MTKVAWGRAPVEITGEDPLEHQQGQQSLLTVNHIDLVRLRLHVLCRITAPSTYDRRPAGAASPPSGFP